MRIIDNQIANNAAIKPHKILGGLGMASVFGSTFYVDSSHTDTTDATGAGTYSHPFETIEYAIGKCTASKGDTILVGPGHTEVVTAAAGIACDVIGITIRGVGNGTLRPKITFTTATTATVTVSAANIRLENLWFECDKTGADHATMLNVTAANCTVVGCVFTEGASTEQTLDYITLGTGADDFRIAGCEFYSYTDGADSAITSGVALDSVHITDCIIRGDFDEAAIENNTAAWTYCVIARNHIKQLASAIDSIELHASATGEIEHNTCYSDVTAGGDATIIDGGDCRCIENYAMDEDADKSGVLTPGTTA